MPLIKSKSKTALRKNIAAEMHAGKPQKQAIAIAERTKRQAGGSGMHHEVDGLIAGADVYAAHRSSGRTAQDWHATPTRGTK